MPSVVNLLAAVLLVVLGCRLAGNAIQRWALSRFTAVNELEELGNDRKDGKKLHGTAVIAGGSIAGLLAARVCSGHFDDVLIIDPDNDVLTTRARNSLPQTPGASEANKSIGTQPRARVMQTKIIHVSQVLNFLALQRLWPDFRAWLKTAGAVVGPAEGMTYMGGIHVPAPKEFYHGVMPEVFSMSRSAYETLLRFLVARIPNVRFTKGTVTGIKPSPQNPKWIESLSYRGSEDGRTVMTQKAHLVLDCSGPTHAGYTWLKRAGYEQPAKEVYDPHMRYYTTEFTVDPAIIAKIAPCGFDSSTPWLLLVNNKLDKEERVLAISHIEHNRIHVMTGGWAFKGVTTTVADMREYTKSLRLSNPVPQWVFDLFDYLEGEPEKTAINNVAAAGSLYYIKYHEARSLPSNFISLGDAAMKVNPVFGQGLTKVMVGCIVLNACLARQIGEIPTSFGKDFFNMLHDKLMTTWDGTKYADYTLDTTDPSEGETLKSGAAMRWFLQRIEELEMAGHREAVWRKFQVIHWMAPPTALMTPSILARVCLQALHNWWIPRDGQKAS